MGASGNLGATQVAEDLLLSQYFRKYVKQSDAVPEEIDKFILAHFLFIKHTLEYTPFAGLFVMPSIPGWAHRKNKR